MITCPLCKRVTSKGESTGKFTTFVETEHENRNLITGEIIFIKGTRIYAQKIVCMSCNGECLFK